MNKHERVRAALRGEPVDRPPGSLWRHFYAQEGSAAGLAEAMIAWVRAFDFDFLKVNPRAEYHVEGWGARYRPGGGEHEKPVRLDYPVKRPEDWRKIEPLPLGTPALAEQLDALGRIHAALGAELPWIETVFAPLMVADRLVGSDEQLLNDLRARPALVHEALAAIAATFAGFARACLAAGASGIFFATTWATRGKLTPAEYDEFGRRYDLQVLDAVRAAPFNVLHVCRSENRLLDLADYPVAAFSWAATDPTNPSLAEAAKKLPGAVIGGLSNEALVAATPELARAEARAALEQTGGRRFFLAGPCSVPTTTRPENVRAAWEALAAWPGS